MSNIYLAIVKSGQPASAERQVVGWNRIEVPDGFEAVQLDTMTDAAWPPAQGDNTPKALLKGKVVDYAPPPPPLSEQAATALQAARQNVYNKFGSLNEPTPADWVSYMKALMAIESGTDTTSTALPVAPAS